MVRVRTAVKEIMGRRSKIDKTDSGLYTVERKWSDWDRLVSSLVAGGMFGLSLISPAAAIADEMPGVPYKKPPEVSSTENPIKEPPKPEEDEVKPRVIACEHEFEGRTNTFARTSLEFKDPKTGLYLL